MATTIQQTATQGKEVEQPKSWHAQDPMKCRSCLSSTPACSGKVLLHPQHKAQADEDRLEEINRSPEQLTPGGISQGNDHPHDQVFQVYIFNFLYICVSVFLAYLHHTQPSAQSKCEMFVCVYVSMYELSPTQTIALFKCEKFLLIQHVFVF